MAQRKQVSGLVSVVPSTSIFALYVVCFPSTSIFVLYVISLSQGHAKDMQPRVVLRSTQRVNQFVEHHVDNLPDVSDKPQITNKSIRYWMYEDNVYKAKPKKRYPKPHSLLKGCRGSTMNESIDFSIAMNKT